MKRIIISGLVGIVVIGAMIAYLYSQFVRPGISIGHEAQAARVRLLCWTDHQALLRACRELSQQVLSERLKTGIYVGADASRYPDVIRDLQPRHVEVDRDGGVRLEMCTGWSPLGVWAYPEGREQPSVGYGDRELLKGLWYYDDGYRLYPEYNKTIDALLAERGKAH